MVYSNDFRWRIVSLIHVYGLCVCFLSDLFGPEEKTIRRWYRMFKETGTVEPNSRPNRTARWPDEVIKEVKKSILEHPTFYIEEKPSSAQQRETPGNGDVFAVHNS